MLATVVLLQHETIKNTSNKTKDKDDKNNITDNNLYFIGGFFVYLSIYFGMSFYHQLFFGMVLN